MHPLAFDKEGRRFQFFPQTSALRVRRFRKPGERGTCEQVFDEDGDALHVEPDATVAELRAAVGNVPGLYRLDQLDEDGNEIDKDTAAYVAIDPTRNGAGGGGADPLLIVRDLARDSAEVSKTLAMSAAGMMSAATENMRVALGGGLGNRRLLALLSNGAVPPGDQGNDDDDDESEDDEAEGDDGDPELPPPTPDPASADPMAVFAMVAPFLKPALPKIGEVLGAKLAEWLGTFIGARPGAGASSTSAGPSAPASAPAPTTSAPASGSAPGPGGGGVAPAAPSDSPLPAGDAAADPVAASTPVSARIAHEAATRLVTTVPAAGTNDVRNAMPSGAQIGHLFAIRALLTPREVAIVDEVITRMDAPTRAGWLAELSALTVDQAVVRVRSQMPSLKSTKSPDHPEEE